MEDPSRSSKHHIVATIKISTASHRMLLARIDIMHLISISPVSNKLDAKLANGGTDPNATIYKRAPTVSLISIFLAYELRLSTEEEQKKL
jgi:hypothetical protein